MKYSLISHEIASFEVSISSRIFLQAEVFDQKIGHKSADLAHKKTQEKYTKEKRRRKHLDI